MYKKSGAVIFNRESRTAWRTSFLASSFRLVVQIPIFFSRAWRLDFLLLRCMTGLMDSVKGIRACRNIIIQSAFLLICVLPGSQPMCKWSNENCNDGSECCSHNCEQAHVGTSARCLRSSLNEPCHADFHCDEYLKCGRQFRCCSPFWGVCTKRSDCCEPEHVCRSEKGFYYRLCLNPARSSGISLNVLARYHAMMMCLVFYLWCYLLFRWE